MVYVQDQHRIKMNINVYHLHLRLGSFLLDRGRRALMAWFDQRDRLILTGAATAEKQSRCDGAHKPRGAQGALWARASGVHTHANPSARKRVSR
jgi:hypothetical protein